MAFVKSPEALAARKMADINCHNAVQALAEVAKFLAYPATLGKCEIGLAISQFMLYANGICLPRNNKIVLKLKEAKRTMAPLGVTNKKALEDVAKVFGGRFWETPGLKDIFSLEGFEPKLRSDLGPAFDTWSKRNTPRTTEGIILDLDITTDVHRTKEWTDQFSLEACLYKSKITLKYIQHLYFKNIYCYTYYPIII